VFVFLSAAKVFCSFGEDEEMTVKELQKMAKKMGIKTRGLRKADMIKEIQRTEGNFDCFGTATDYCDQMGCLFRNDCLS
jgi:hypothetical protein